MKLNYGLHLAYCTNIHRGESWQQTFEVLQQYTLAVKERVCPKGPYAIGLRLSDLASRELNDHQTLLSFKRWLDQNHCYVFTINGFPYGRFHGGPVKEKVYWPDWTTPERLAYTNRLFDILAQLLPVGVEGSVSTVPGSFKEFIKTPDQLKAIRGNIWHCVEHVARVSQQTGRTMHLGLEPEPLCLLETSTETVYFFDRLRAEHNRDPRLFEFLGVNYDTCHLAVEFEEPANALYNFQQHQIKISKLHLSSALKVVPTPEACEELKKFVEDVYFHQVIVREENGQLLAYRDLPDVLMQRAPNPAEEWRIHFHVPLHSPANALFGNTTDHLTGVLDILAGNPQLCSHLEMETYTWEVMPDEMKNRNVVDQLVGEYDWCLDQLAQRGLAQR
ncbi:MAG: metabolite traffic protein EboE [Verrucomicrobia bacterium]|nr:metabolite traffic protein EboE [Verrucomicrobiota bacterium]